MSEHIRTTLKALMGHGGFTPSNPIRGGRWRTVGEVGASAKDYFSKAKGALDPEKGVRVGRIRKVVFHLKGTPGKEENIRNVLLASNGHNGLKTDLTGVTIQHDGNGNYRLVALQEEHPANQTLKEVQKWWEKEHVPEE
ncbi:hypothetical protein HY572_04095 [Candidatus Micrarchaeota archaeon]|nr:hypothetical protein [Candidatus Micrarchaeota archaeon]